MSSASGGGSALTIFRWSARISSSPGPADRVACRGAQSFDSPTGANGKPPGTDFRSRRPTGAISGASGCDNSADQPSSCFFVEMRNRITRRSLEQEVVAGFLQDLRKAAPRLFLQLSPRHCSPRARLGARANTNERGSAQTVGCLNSLVLRRCSQDLPPRLCSARRYQTRGSQFFVIGFLTHANEG